MVVGWYWDGIEIVLGQYLFIYSIYFELWGEPNYTVVYITIKRRVMVFEIKQTKIV